MSKKLLSFIMAAIMVFSMTVVSVQAEAPKVFAGPVTYSADPNTATGSITASVTVYNTTNTVANATLIVATYNGDVLSNVKYDSKSIPAYHAVDLSATIEKESGETLRSFVWDGFSTLTPVEIETAVYSLNLSEGTQANHATTGVPTTITATDGKLLTTLGQKNFTYVADGLTGKTLTADSWSVENFDNKKCFSIFAKSSQNYGMQCMDYSDTIFSNDVKYEDVTIYVKYFDNSEGLFTIRATNHNGTKTTGTTSLNIWGTKSNTWKTAIYHAPVLGGKTTYNAEFWVTPNPNWSEAPLYISEVGVITH